VHHLDVGEAEHLMNLKENGILQFARLTQKQHAKANISAEKETEGQGPWIPIADVQEKWRKSPVTASRQGPKASDSQKSPIKRAFSSSSC
jgi:hypothetical protein